MTRWLVALAAVAVIAPACGPEEPSVGVPSVASTPSPTLSATSVVANTSGDIGATATGPDVADMCDDPQQPYAAAYDRVTGEFRWAACEESPGFRYLKQVTDDAVYLLGPVAEATFVALDPTSGNRIDAAAPPPTTPGLTGEPGQPITTVVDGVTISGGQDDPTIATDTDGNGLWTQPGHWTYDDVAAIDDGAVFALEYLDNGDFRLVGYELDSGEIRWEASGSAYLEGLWPWLAQDQQLFTGWANLQARSTVDGTIIWATRWLVDDPFAPGAAHVSGVALDDDTVYLALVSESGPGD